MIRLVLTAVASVTAGLLLGAAAVLGATLVAQGDTESVNQGYEKSTAPNQVQYGDRSIHAHYLPCKSKPLCLGRLP